MFRPSVILVQKCNFGRKERVGNHFNFIRVGNYFNFNVYKNIFELLTVSEAALGRLKV